MDEVAQSLRSSFNANISKPTEWRKNQLQNLKRMINDNKELLYGAIYKDLRRPRIESISGDLRFVTSEVDLALKNLSTWTKSTRTSVNMTNLPAVSEIVYEPYGVCLIIGPFNFPIQLTLTPLVGAIAAGNCAVIKPSELSPHCSQVMADLIPKYLDTKCFQVVTGGVEVSTALLAQKWDKIFFTGGTRVGKIVMKAAAEYLTPVSLELGGKSPAIIDENVDDIHVTCRRIIWGKCMNAGQICIAPDYILCHRKLYTTLLTTLKETIIQFYGENVKNSPDLARIVSTGHCKRLVQLLESVQKNGHVYYGGEYDIEDKYISPTIITNVTFDSPIMKEEIFGPLLPVLPYDNYDDLLKILKYSNNSDLENPLALYLFTSNHQLMDQVVNDFASGGVCVNDTVVHVGNPCVPFGGRGSSGIGGYHGFYSFEAFSHKKPVLIRSGSASYDAMARYPPYNEKTAKMMETFPDLPIVPTFTYYEFITRFLICSTIIMSMFAILMYYIIDIYMYDIYKGFFLFLSYFK